MAVVVNERFRGSRSLSQGGSNRRVLVYSIEGTEDEREAMAAMLAEAPTTYDPHDLGVTFWPRSDYTVDEDGLDLWVGIVTYSPAAAPDRAVLSGQTGGATRHITQARKHKLSKGVTGGPTPPDHKGAINVVDGGNGKEVQGVDIKDRFYSFSQRYIIPAATFDEAYQDLIYALTGCVHGAESGGPPADFQGRFAHGTLILDNVTYNQRDDGDFDVTFDFSAAPNLVNFVPDGTGFDPINAYGWDYVWIEYEDKKSGDYIVRRPKAIHVEQAYPYADLNVLGI